MKKRTAASIAALTLVGASLGTAQIAQADGMGHDHDHAPRVETLSAALTPVPTNHVRGSGTASVILVNDEATVRINATGLVPDAPHAMHIHIDGEGRCPTRSEAGVHNGHRAMSTTDGMDAYGKVGTSLTTTGDTSPDSVLALDRYPVGSTIHYERTFKLSHDTVEALRDHTAVIVVHGIDYDGSGRYTDVLGPSDLDASLPMTATAPALCGVLGEHGEGAVEAGAGGTQGGALQPELYGAAGVLMAGAAGALALRRRRAAQG